jgi:hypothetical protein
MSRKKIDTSKYQEYVGGAKAAGATILLLAGICLASGCGPAPWQANQPAKLVPKVSVTQPTQKVVPTTPAQKVAPTTEAPKRAAEDASWAPPDKAVRQGDLQVQIDKVAIDYVEAKGAFGNQRSEKKWLIIRLTMLNTSQTKKIEYKSWSGGYFTLGDDCATLHDNFDNSYKRVNVGFGYHPVGGVDHDESIRPGSQITDVLVFELPLSNATHLDLKLPAANYGGEGFIRFRIPTKVIAGNS